MKNWINTNIYKKPILALLFICSAFLVTGRLYAPALGTQAPAPAPAMQDLSPQQMAELEQELQKINEEMQAFVKTLPPEKQEEIAQLEEAINNMSDDELEQLFEQLFNDPAFLQELGQMYPEQPAQEPVAAEPEPEKPVEKPIEKPKVEKNKLAQAAEMIKSLNELTESFLSKLDNVHEIDDLVRNWMKKNQLRGWRKNVAWHDVKAQIELFNQKLRKLLYQEPGTKEYRFLPDLIKEESLYNNLAHMESVLKLIIPKIEVSVFGFAKQHAQESKDKVLDALNKYAEGMSNLQLIPAINVVIEKHEPIAKQMREKEENLAKKALEESKKPRQEKPMVYTSRGNSHGYGNKDRGYEDVSYYPSYDGYQPNYVPSYGAQPEQAGQKPAGEAGAGAGKGGAKAPGKGDKGGKEDKKEKAGKEDKDQGGKKGGKEKKDEKKGKENNLAQNLADVEDALKEANENSSNPYLIHMRKYLMTPGQLEGLGEYVQASVNKINAATKSINKLGESLQDKPEKTKKEYQGRVRTAFNRQGNLVAIESQIQSLQEHPIDLNKVPADKKKAYGFAVPQKKKKEELDEARETAVDADVEVAAPAQDADQEEALILEEAQRQAMQAERPAEEAQEISAEGKAQPSKPARGKTTAAVAEPAETKEAAQQPISSLEAALNELHEAIEKLTK